MLHKVTVLKVMGARGAKRAWLACCLRLWDFVHLDAKPAPVRGSAGPQRLNARWMGRLKLARQPQGFLMNKNASWIQSGSISTQGKKKASFTKLGLSEAPATLQGIRAGLGFCGLSPGLAARVFSSLQGFAGAFHAVPVRRGLQRPFERLAQRSYGTQSRTPSKTVAFYPVPIES